MKSKKAVVIDNEKYTLELSFAKETTLEEREWYVETFIYAIICIFLMNFSLFCSLALTTFVGITTPSLSFEQGPSSLSKNKVVWVSLCW